MNVATIFGTSLSSLGANKLRAGLTLLGIVIGVAAVISLMAIGRGVQQSITDRIQSLGTNLLFVRPGQASLGGVFGGQGSATTLTLDDAYALLDPVFARNVVAVAPELTTSGQLVAGRENTSTQIVGITPEYSVVRNFPVAYGQFISHGHVQNSSQVVVLGSAVAETLFGFRDPVGQVIRINGRQFRVIGVLSEKGGGAWNNRDDTVVAPYLAVISRLKGTDRLNSITVQAHSAEEVEKLESTALQFLNDRYRITDKKAGFQSYNRAEAASVARWSAYSFCTWPSWPRTHVSVAFDCP